MLSDTAHSEADEDDGASIVSDGSVSNSFMQSIYNIGRNVVAGWSSSGSSRPYPEDGSEPLLGNTEPATSESEGHVTNTAVSQPIPLPYYPLYSVDNTASFNSIIVPYRRFPLLQNTPLYNNYNYLCSSSSNLTAFPSNLPSFPSNLPTFPSNHLHLPHYQDVSLSDSDIPGSSSRLQNRIARKLNRQRRMRGRRSHSTSDITSNVTSESEVDVF